MRKYILFSKLPKVIAHRGASGYAPENTLAAFAYAKKLNISWVEFDVQLSKDNIPVIYHDDDLLRTCGINSLVVDKNYDELKNLDCGSWFGDNFASEKILTLEETLEFLKAQTMYADIELKVPDLLNNNQEYLKNLAKVSSQYIRTTNYTNVIISSFNLDILKYCRTFEPDLPLGIILDVPKDINAELIAEITRLNCTFIGMNKDLIHSDKFVLLQQTGLPIIAYTVNIPEDAAKLSRFGVKHFFSDYPEIIHASKLYSL